MGKFKILQQTKILMTITTTLITSISITTIIIARVQKLKKIFLIIFIIYKSVTL